MSWLWEEDGEWAEMQPLYPSRAGRLRGTGWTLILLALALALSLRDRYLDLRRRRLGDKPGRALHAVGRPPDPS